VHFISIRQVSFDVATLLRGRCGHAAQWLTRPHFTPPSPLLLLLMMMLLCIGLGNLMINKKAVLLQR